jgi:predicted solute-binding protein
MRLAVWNTPPAEFLVSGFTSGAVDSPYTIERYRPEACAARLVEGDADVALLPSLMALQAADSVDVIPGTALVSWKYPFARLVWKGGLHDMPATVDYDRRDRQEQFIARVIMQEHYGKAPEFIAREDATPQRLLEADGEAALLVGSDVPSMEFETFTMDVGREWFELANYPMVWGLFVTKRGVADEEIIEPLIASAQAADANRDVWMQAHETSPRLREFYEEDLRTGIDRLAVASLTEFRKYLFYYGVTEEVPDLPLVYLDELEDEEEEDS